MSLKKTSSIVIGKSVPSLLSKHLAAEGCRVTEQTAGTGDALVEFKLQPSGGVSPAGIVKKMAVALVVEACGAPRGVVKRPEGDVELDSEGEVATHAFASVTKSIDIPWKQLPDHSGVAAIAEMTYSRCLQREYPGTVMLVTGFPPCLAASNERVDYVIAGLVILSYQTDPSGATATLRANVKAIEALMGRMCSADFVASVLPAKWQEVSKENSKVELDALTELMDDAQQAISDWWQDSAADERAKAYVQFLMSSVGADLRSYFKGVTAVSGGVFRCNAKFVEAALSACAEWRSVCEKLTSVDWGAEWKGGLYKDPALDRFCARMQTAIALRTMHEEAKELLGIADLRAMRGDTLWDVMDATDVFDVAPAMEATWQAALVAFNRRVEPIEHRCAAQLREFFASRVSLAPQAILNEFMQYRELIKRPIVAKELQSERDTLLAKLTERVQTIRHEYERRSGSLENEAQLVEDRRTQAGKYMPGVVNKIVWIRQLRGKINRMIQMAERMLSDLARAHDFIESANRLLEDLHDFEQDSFKNWTFDIGDNARTLTLDASAPVLKLDAQGKIEVNYSERLVELLREVRLFTAMGFAVPAEIKTMSEQAMKFYQPGVALKQVANVYNTMHADIIRSTQAMLYDSALAFENTVGGSASKITWSNKADTEKFIQKLRKASASLSQDNRTLHRLHNEIIGLVIDLFKIDLLRSRDRWMARVRQIRDKIFRSNFGNTEAWTAHWDKQLYKALEVQYQKGLESLHETLPEIRVDVVYDAKTGRAVLRPPITEVRQTFYTKLKDFLTFPIRFTGVGRSDFFKKMPGRNEKGIMTVLSHAGALFKKVEKTVKQFQPMLVLGQCGKNGAFTLEEIVSAALTEVQHWEQNIRLLKQKGREIGHVDMFLRIDCITLCTAGIKSAIEEQLSTLAAVLNSTLQSSALAHITKINEFLDEASKTLDAQATKLEDITKASVAHASLHEKRPTFEVEFHHFNAKNKLLQSMTNGPGIVAHETKERWDHFVTRLESYEKEMEAQLESLKAGVGDAVAAFFKELEKFQAQWNELKPKDPKAQGAPKFIAEKREKFDQLKATAGDLKAQCSYFSIDEPDLGSLKDLEDDLTLYESMWETMSQFKAESATLREEPWIAFRSKLLKFEDFVKNWQDTLREKPPSPISLYLRTLLDEWNRLIPMLKFVRGDGMTPTHWAEMFRIIGIERGITQDSLLFGHILDRHESILGRDKELKALHARAQGEAQIREALDDVRNWAKTAEFHLVPHSDRPGVKLITEWKEVMTQVNDNQALMFSLKDSPYFGPFAEDAQQWEAKLTRCDDYLHHMNQIQRKWVYLEPIFARGALPQEQARFERTDKDYLGVMSTIARDPKVVSVAQHTDWAKRLRDVLEQLERCQKALNEFLEQKRSKFPRFYFISDDDLLEILGQSRNVTVIQAHLKKLFMGIHSVVFDKNKQHIVEICSLEGEKVVLGRQVEITAEVEDWLTELDKEMKKTLTGHLVACTDKLDIALYASQILCTAESIHFTRDTEDAMKQGASGLREMKSKLTRKLKDLTTFAAGNTDDLMGLKLRALIMDLIHFIEVEDMLISNNTTLATDWKWSKQLRFYLDRQHQCLVRMVDAQFKYTYEYQGNAPKLVHTPLTDKCYLTLTQGMHLGYGGNPYGPAGTGKTESVKALGNAMARQVLVFNCDEGIDFQSMGRIFTGLVKCGAWGCFDEFNRLKVDQLSAVSQMIQVIQEALKQGESTCGLLGRTVEVNPSAGIFVTLNPAGKGYGGRSVLPDNLKQLFRAVAMSAPDLQLITETILYSEGFENAPELGKKVVEIFRLSKQLLSYQQHYDWGLRALKAVLRLSGSLVRSFLAGNLKDGKTPKPAEVLEAESEIIIKALRVNTLSKLTFDDVKLFNALIADVFPDTKIREIQYDELRPAILEAIKELKLQTLETQIAKILQLYEALQQRMGVVLVGPSGSGKSTLLKILRKAMQRLGVKVPLYAMNPKALPREQLLGHMDPDTREWYDGVLTEAAKKVVREEPSVRSWIFCDGDIDPEWVESLNSVLDDNKLLTMPNGVRIQFGGNVNFVFETHSLEFASPATVSRMGMIFLSEDDVDAKSAIQSWLNEQPPEYATKLKEFLGEYFDKAIEMLYATKAMVVQTTRMGLVTSALSQLYGVNNKAHFAMAMVMSLGSFLPEVHRVEYAKDLFHLVGIRAPDPRAPLDCVYDHNRAGLSPLQYEPSLDLTVDDLKGYPMINTVDCQRNLATMEAWVNSGHNRPFILVGPEGCGKTMLLQNCFARLNNVRIAVVNCSAQTVAAHVIQKLQQTCQTFNTNQGRVLRPKDADRLILLLKDLNLPKPDKYSTVQLHSLLQQLVLYQGFYDKDLEWVTVERVQIVGSMNPPGSMGRFPVAPRFLAIVSVLYVSYPAKASLETVYSDFFNTLLQSPQLQSLPHGVSGKSAADYSRALCHVYEGVTKKFTLDDASHYIFNPRDLTKWALSVLTYNSDGTTLLEILQYEANRIFSDRLKTSDDRKKFDKLLMDALASLSFQSKDSDKDRFYVSWLDPAKGLSTTKIDDLKKSGDAAKKQYLRENHQLNVEVIPETLAWMARLDRVLSSDNGNALIVGRSGTGGAEILQLAAYQKKMAIHTLVMTRHYGVKQFHQDIKVAVVQAGVEASPCVLFIEDYNMANPAFLERINSLLSSGEIPGLFAQEELDAMLGPLKEEALGEGFSDGAYAYFVHRVRKNLHVMVVMDPANEEYELRCRSNPALFTRCNVMWLGTFQHDSMKLLPKMLLKDVFRSLDQREEKDADFQLHRELVKLHDGAGEKFSPQHFKSLMMAYQEIFNTKSSASGERMLKLQRGLSKLAEAEVSVAEIQKQVQEQQVLMTQKQKEADEALVEIQKKMEEAGEQKKKVKAIQKDIDAESVVVNEKKEVIQGKLSGVQPTLDAAKEAVGQIKSEHLSELKSMKTPPAAVQDVMEGVLTLLGKSDMSWAGCKKFLAGANVKTDILHFQVETINHAIRDSVNRLLQAKENSFKQEVIGRASKAAEPMAAWIKAMIQYSLVVESIQPMRDELRGYEENLAKINEKLQKYEDKLRKLDGKIEELKKNFGEKTKEAERLRDRLEQAEATLKSAEELLGKLSGEKVRWNQQTGAIKAEERSMPRRALVAAGFMTYLGAEPEDARRDKVNEWATAQNLDAFDFFTFLRTESTQLLYKSQGLPSDGLSMENAVSILDHPRVPLIVDPANQAAEWLKTHLKSKDVVVDVCTPADERFTHTLELACRFGKTLLVTEVDKIEPILYPLIRKELIAEGPKKVVRIGDKKSVDYAEGFRLFLLTRSTDLKLPPDVAGYLAEINFTITRGGLESQLLGVTIQKEQPELEQQKIELLQKEEELKLKLAGLEEKLLKELASSEGSLLDNKALIDSLNEIKTQSQEIEASLEKSKQLATQLDEKRNVYRPLAARGSVVFFLMRDMVGLSHMYQFSLSMFLAIFGAALNSLDGKELNTEDKIDALRRTLVQMVVASVSRSLFKADRVTFGVHLARALTDNCCTAGEWDYFVDKSTVSVDPSAAVPSWVLEDSVKSFRLLQAAFPALIQQLQVHESDTWYQWMRSATPEHDFPRFFDKLSGFQRLMVVKALRNDRLIAAMNAWACHQLQVDTLSPATTLAGLLSETKKSEPILLLTTPGADPSMELQELAHEKVGKQRFFQVAMGGGQQEEAMRLLHQCSEQGQWLCLKNLHLVIPWVSALEAELNLLKPHKNFRLWLTSEPHDAFPSILLSTSLKVTFEAPPGVKANMLRTFNSWTPAFLKSVTPVQANLLFSLAFIHSILQERRSYIPQGWAKFYEFSAADIKSAADVIVAQSRGEKVDYDSIHGVLENAIYGGRMENDYDVRILTTYLSQIVSEDVLFDAKRQRAITRGITLPGTQERDEYVKLVQQGLADSDIPALFQLPPNADRTVQRHSVAGVVGNLLKLHERREISQMSREEWVALVTPLLQLWQHLCSPHAAELSHVREGKRDARPIEGYVQAEADNSLALVATVEATMADLRHVIDGTLLLSEKLKSESAAMIEGEVPAAWDGRFSGPENIIPWLTALVRKAVAIQKWEGWALREANLLSQRLNLADLFRPETFLNALRQETARRTRQPLVSLQMACAIGADPPGCQLAVQLHGLLLQGCTIDGGVLADVASSDAPAVCVMPDLHVGWVPPAAPEESTVPVPVYTNLSKEKFLCEWRLKSASIGEIPKHVLAGVAIVLEE